jgi:hypothetical protein
MLGVWTYVILYVAIGVATQGRHGYETPTVSLGMHMVVTSLMTDLWLNPVLVLDW